MNLQVGQKVVCAGMGFRSGHILQIHGKQTPESIHSLAGGAVVMGGTADVDVVWENGTMSNRVPESIVRGLGWQVYDEVADAVTLAAAVEHCERETMRREEEDRKQAVARAEEADSLPKQLPWLTLVSSSSKSAAAVGAANLRKALARQWPGVKFSVRSEYFSGGCAISVRWSGGPEWKEVDVFSDKFQTADFDGMDDSTTDRHNVFTSLFGGARFVSCSREG
jgi:hypothetical protein